MAVNLTMLEDSNKGMYQRRGVNHRTPVLPEDLGLVPGSHTAAHILLYLQSQGI